MSTDITLAICAYNAAGRLPATLAHMAAQQVPPGVRFDVLVVDNNSNDDTSRVAADLAARLGLAARVVREPTPGKVHALRRAIAEAAGGLIAIIDDDNHLAPGFVAAAVEFFRAHPRAGMVGPRIDAAFEPGVTPPPDFDEKYAWALAIRNLGDSPRLLRMPADSPPPGAGSTARTAILRHIIAHLPLQLAGPTGSALTRGEDSEMAACVQHLGFELWYEPAMRMAHLMPAGRLTQAYLHRLIVDGAQAAPWVEAVCLVSPRRGRIGNALLAVHNAYAAVKLRAVAAIRGRRGDPLLGVWAAIHANRARGHWMMARHDPQRRLDAALQSHPFPDNAATSGK